MPAARRPRRSPLPAWLLRDLARIGLGALIGLLLGALLGWLQSPDYRVTGEVVVDGRVAFDGSDGVAGATGRDVVTHQRVIESQAVASQARRLVGDGVGTVTTRAAGGSDAITVEATASSPHLARDTLDASLDTYLVVLEDQQREAVEAELAVLDDRADIRSQELADLDGVLARTPPERQATVVQLQSGQRSEALDSLSDARDRAHRLRAASDGLPVNVTRLESPYAVATRLGPLPWQTALTGAVLGAAVAALALAALYAAKERAARRSAAAPAHGGTP